MSTWTHNICEECWSKKNPNSEPIKVIIDLGTAICCFCGKEHRSGIFVRANPDDTKCKGIH